MEHVLSEYAQLSWLPSEMVWLYLSFWNLPLNCRKRTISPHWNKCKTTPVGFFRNFSAYCYCRTMLFRHLLHVDKVYTCHQMIVWYHRANVRPAIATRFRVLAFRIGISIILFGIGRCCAWCYRCRSWHQLRKGSFADFSLLKFGKQRINKRENRRFLAQFYISGVNYGIYKGQNIFFSWCYKVTFYRAYRVWARRRILAFIGIVLPARCEEMRSRCG